MDRVTSCARALPLLSVAAIGPPLLFPGLGGGRVAPYAAVLAVALAAWGCAACVLAHGRQRFANVAYGPRPLDGQRPRCTGFFRPVNHSRWMWGLPALTVPIVVLLGTAMAGLSVSIDASLSWRRIYSLIFAITLYFVVLGDECGGMIALANRRGRRGWQDHGVAGMWQVLFLAMVVVVAAGAWGGIDWTAYKLPVLSGLVSSIPRLVGPVASSTRDTADINPNQAGGLLVLGWPALVSAGIYSWTAKRRVAALLITTAAAACGAVLFLTLSRSALAGGAVAVLVLLLCQRGRLASFATRAYAILLAGGGALTLFALALGQEVVGVRAGTLLSAGVEWTSRVDLWGRALQMLRDRPLTGSGVNTLPLLLQQRYPVGPGGDPYAPHAHNLLLQTGVDFGLPGIGALICIAAAQWCSARRVLRTPDSFERAIAVGVMGGLVGHAVFGLTDAVAIGAKAGFLLWWAFALLEAASRRALALEPGPSSD
jgi:hypothetical protein